MADVLKGLKPQRVFEIFEDICDKKAYYFNKSCWVGYMCPDVVYI